jgi:hypothetical protein
MLSEAILGMHGEDVRIGGKIYTVIIKEDGKQKTLTLVPKVCMTFDGMSDFDEFVGGH